MYGAFPKSHKPDFSSGKKNKKKNKTKIALTAKNETIFLWRLFYYVCVFCCVMPVLLSVFFFSRTIRCALVWLVNGIRSCFVMNCHHSSLSNGFNKTKRKILTELNRIGKMRWKIKLEFSFFFRQRSIPSLTRLVKSKMLSLDVHKTFMCLMRAIKTDIDTLTHQMPILLANKIFPNFIVHCSEPLSCICHCICSMFGVIE